MTNKVDHENRDYFIYIVISETPTEFGRLIRKFAKIKYNHASIAFDAEFKQLYSFGRRQYKNPLNAGLVKEYPDRFSLRRYARINASIYKIPVTKEQYLSGKSRILEIRHDTDGYIYNLFSVLTYNWLKGIHTYKAYTCAEFVAHMIRVTGISDLDPAKLSCKFTPDEIGRYLNEWLIFEGNLLEYCSTVPNAAGNFFDDPGYRQTAMTYSSIPVRLLYRKIRFRNKFAAIL